MGNKLELYLDYHPWSGFEIGYMGEVSIAYGDTIEDTVRGCFEELSADGQDVKDFEIIGLTSSLELHRHRND